MPLIRTTRTARYFTAGNTTAPRELWVLLHGYGQLGERFLRDFRWLDDGTRLLVAPEALARHYTRGGSGSIGASWMTREMREEEIADYIEYLDAVYSDVIRSLDATPSSITLLGFSQGTATAGRWACMGSANVERLILWGGFLPLDLDPEAHLPKLRSMRIQLVAGIRDEYADPIKVNIGREWMEERGIEYEWIEFDGGHEIVVVDAIL